jgi:cytochrome oxidase Cu insertion factor (SCO1/SenC/PrrC family)
MTRGRHRTLAIGLALALLALGGLTSPAAADKAFEDAMFELQLVPIQGVPAPFTLERLGDGKKVSLAEHRGRPVMLYFWATW